MTTDRDRLKDEVIARLQGAGLISFIASLGHDPKRQGREHMIVCPFHEDSKPSLGINTTKNPNGIIKCFACGWGGDVFKFVQDSLSLPGFKETLDYIAQRLGLMAGQTKAGAKPIEKREVVKRDQSTPLSVEQLLAALHAMRERKEDPAIHCNGMGLDPAALDLMGAFFCRIRRQRSSGRYEPDSSGTLCMVVPQRTNIGRLCSLRFRSMEKREPGESAKRWSIDQSAPNDPETQLHHSIAGLMGMPDVFDEPPKDGQLSLVVEGETDLAAGLTMMLNSKGPDPAAWPARFVAIPGVGNCHEMLTPELLGTWACCFLDSDMPAKLALFDHRKRVCEWCEKVVQHRELCKCGGRAITDLTSPMQPGLLSKLQRGLDSQGKVTRAPIRAMAAFPPAKTGGKKTDLRDLVRAGIAWDAFFEYLTLTATKRTRMVAA